MAVVLKKIAAVMLLGLLMWLMCPSMAAAAPAEPSPPEEAAASAKNVTGSLNLQTSIPEPRYVVPDLPPPPRTSIGLPEGVLKAMLWVAVGIMLAIIILTIKDSLWSHSRAQDLEAEAEELAPAPTIARMNKVQLAADDLAGSGDFAQAMHLLLLQSIGEFRRRLDVSIAASLTSREILAHVRLNPEGRGAFGDIIGRVEISYFGPHKPGVEEYQACRQSYEMLTASLGGGRGRHHE